MAVPQKLALACFTFGGGGFGSGVGVFLSEALDATGGVNQLLLASEKRMAARADFHAQHVALDGRASLKGVAASTVHCNGVIVGMNTGFHEAPFCRVRSARHLDKVGDYSRVAWSRGNSLSYAKCQIPQNGTDLRTGAGRLSSLSDALRMTILALSTTSSNP